MSYICEVCRKEIEGTYINGFCHHCGAIYGDWVAYPRSDDRTDKTEIYLNEGAQE